MSIAAVFVLLSLAAWMPNEVSAQQVAYRLVGSPRSNEGRVEVSYSGTWGTVCDDFFNDVAARVFCRSIGYQYGGICINNQWGAGEGTIWLDDVSCRGDEQSIDDCSHRPVGEHNCGHYEDVSIRCYTDQSEATTPPDASSQVHAEGWRLVDPNSPSSNPTAGRLEVLINGEWGNVCDDGFTDTNARVACFSLGYGYIGSFVFNTYGGGTGQIWLDEVRCYGGESDIGACGHNPVGVHDCSHFEDVSISCTADGIQAGGNTTVSPPPLNATVSASTTSLINNSSQVPVHAEGWRLVDPNSPSSNPIAGRLEVLINGEWGNVCDDGFTDTNARVACFSLGYGYVGSFVYNTYGGGTGQIWLDEVRCYGGESDIGACGHNALGVHDCGHYEDVSISCTTDGIQAGGNTTVSPPPLNATAYASATTFRSNLSTSQGSFAPTFNANSTTARTNASTTSRSNFSTSQGSLAPANANFNANPTTVRIVSGNTTTRASSNMTTVRANATTTRPTTPSLNAAINGTASTTRSNTTSARVNALYNATTSRVNTTTTTRLTTRINALIQTTRIIPAANATTVRANVTTARPSSISPARK